MRIRIDLKIFIFLIVFYFTKQIELYSIIMIFAIIHEMGHMLMGILLDLKPEKVEIMPFGVAVSFKLKLEDYNEKIKNARKIELKKIAIAIAGPLTNLILILIFLYLPNTNKKIVYANLLIMLFNLIPIFPLDGGRILKSMIHIFKGYKTAIIYINKISNIVLLIITMVSSIAILYYKNIAIFLIIMFLWKIVIKENIKFGKMQEIL